MHQTRPQASRVPPGTGDPQPGLEEPIEVVVTITGVERSLLLQPAYEDGGESIGHPAVDDRTDGAGSLSEDAGPP